MEESDWRPSRSAGHGSSTSKGFALPIFKAKIVMVDRLASSAAPQRQEGDQYEATTSAVFPLRNCRIKGCRVRLSFGRSPI